MTPLYVLNPDGEFTLANADDILACAHHWIAYYYRCGEPILPNRWVHQHPRPRAHATARTDCLASNAH